MTLARKLAVALGATTIVYALVFLFWGPAPFAFSFDDAYYYFTIARNWADGYASTFDRIDRTNGYHPLWQLVSVVPFLAGFEGLGAVRFLLLVQLTLWVGAMGAVIRVIVDAIDGWPRLEVAPAARRFCDTIVVVAFVVLAANPFVLKMTVNGLESGLVIPIGALLIAHSVRFRGRYVTRASSRERLVAGSLVALAFLARTDAAILLAVLALWCLLDAGKPNRPWRVRIVAMVQLFAIPFVVIVAYLAVNQAIYGTAMQISGTIKRLPITPLRGLLVVVWAAAGIGLILAARRPIAKSSRVPMTRRFVAATGFYGAFCVGILGYYTTLQQVPYLWYFAPLALYGTFLLVLLIADLAQGAVLEATQASKPTTGAAVRLPALILAAPLVLAHAWSVPGILDPGARSLMVHDAAAGRWIDENLPADARVGSWDAGTIGFFANRQIVNLDGVVNTVEWHEAILDGRTAEFLAERNVDWVANHGADVDGADPDIDGQIRGLFGADRIERIVVVHRDTYDFTGTLDGSRTDTSTKRMGSYVYRLER